MDFLIGHSEEFLKCFSLVLQDEWENDRSVMLSQLNELNMRATRAEQRVLELEQLLRDHALVALDETCDDSDIVTSTSQHDCFNEVFRRSRHLPPTSHESSSCTESTAFLL